MTDSTHDAVRIETVRVVAGRDAITRSETFRSAMSHRDHPVTDHRSVVDVDTQFLDVREPDEFASGTLPGTVNVPLGELAAHVGELDPSRRVVLLCRSGNRSGRAAEFLVDSGFDDVVNLAGGMLALEQEHTS